MWIERARLPSNDSDWNVQLIFSSSPVPWKPQGQFCWVPWLVWLPWVPFHCDAGDGGGRQANFWGLGFPGKKPWKTMIIPWEFRMDGDWMGLGWQMELSLLTFVQNWDMQFLNVFNGEKNQPLDSGLWINLERKAGDPETMKWKIVINHLIISNVNPGYHLSIRLSLFGEYQIKNTP